MERAGEHGYLWSFFIIGEYYRTGSHAIPEDAAKAVSWYRRGADLGDVLSQSAMGFAYEYGRGVTKDIGQAMAWYRKAADQGDVGSLMVLGRHYEYGEGVEVNKDAALCWYQKAAQSDGRFNRTQAEQAIAHLGKPVSSDKDRGQCQ